MTAHPAPTQAAQPYHADYHICCTKLHSRLKMDDISPPILYGGFVTLALAPIIFSSGFWEKV